MISYAQNFEDVILWRALKHIEQGFYIDVGAWSPDLDSVTRHFYENSWTGINIEPNPEFYAQYLDKRINDINLNLAVSDSIGQAEIFFSENPGLSSLDKEIAEGHKSIGFGVKPAVTEVTTLEKIFSEKAKSKDIHFLKVDVEGLEEKVLAGNDWSQFRPWIVLVEATLPMSQVENYEQWESILLNADYQFVYADGLNRFYIAKEHAELAESFKYPPNVFDGFVLASQVHNQAKASEAEAKASEAEAKASEAEAKSCALEGQLRTVEQDLSTKLTQLNQAQQRIVELEFADKHYAILLQTKELALENIRTNLALEIFAHNKAEEKGLDLKSQLDVASQQFGSVSSALESAKNNISKLQSALSLSESELKVAELAIQQKKSELEAVLTEQKSIQLALVNQQQETEKLQQELNASLGNAHNWYLKAQEFETNLHSTNQQLADSLSNAHHWYLAASLHIERVEAMEKTISWKITKPLRLLKKWTITIVKSPWLLIKSMAKAVLNPLMRFVLNRPSLKDKLLNKIKKFPSLFNRLKLFAQNQNLIFGYQQIITEQKLNQAMELELQQSVQRVDANSPLSMQEELTQLSPRAKQIYTQLKQAIENQKNKS